VHRVRGFYPILDTELASRRGIAVVDAAEAILDAGARVLQFRHKTFFSRQVFEEAERIAHLCRTAGTLFIVNDRADIGALIGAGLHLGQEDLTPVDARKVVPAGTVIGFSTHSEAQLRAGDREPVDYLAFGPIFATVSKQNPDPIVGIEELRRLRSVTSKPLVAIGGITRETASAVLQAGADAVAIIGDLFPDPCSSESLRSRAEQLMAISSPRK